MDKKRKKIFIALLVLIILTIVVSSYLYINKESQSNELSYPGNGLPLISKNKPVDKINIEMQNYFGKYEFLKHTGNNLVFNNIPHSVKYQSLFNLQGPETNFALDISLNAGKAIINIGDIEYEITPNESNINQGNKKIYSMDDLKITGISIEKISTQAVARFWGDGWSRGDYVNLNFPVNISIELLENSSGEVGQWKWVRGFK
jgi:hypothetical protein